MEVAERADEKMDEMKYTIVNGHRRAAKVTLWSNAGNRREKISTRSMPPMTQATVSIGHLKTETITVTSVPKNVVTIHRGEE